MAHRRCSINICQRSEFLVWIKCLLGTGRSCKRERLSSPLLVWPSVLPTYCVGCGVQVSFCLGPLTHSAFIDIVITCGITCLYACIHSFPWDLPNPSMTLLTLLTKSRLLTTAPQILCELTSDPLFNHTDILVHQTVCEIFYLQAFTHAVSSAWISLPTWLS